MHNRSCSFDRVHSEQHYGRRFLILTSELIESELHVHVACGVHVRLLEPS